MPSISYFYFFSMKNTLAMILCNTVATTVLIASLIILVALAVTAIHSIDTLSLTLSHLSH